MKPPFSFLFFCFASLTFCQQSEKNFLAPLPSGMCCFLRADFLEPPEAKPRENLFNFQAVSYKIAWEEKPSFELRPYERQAPETIQNISRQAIQANLRVIRQNAFKRRGEGSFGRRLRHVVTEGTQSLGQYNAATWYYQRISGTPNLFNPKTRYDYFRNQDPLSWTGRQVLNALKRGLIREFGPDVKKWLKW